MQLLFTALIMVSAFVAVSVLFLAYKKFLGSFLLIKKYYEIKFYDFLLFDEDAIEELRKISIKKLHNEMINKNNNDYMDDKSNFENTEKKFLSLTQEQQDNVVNIVLERVEKELISYKRKISLLSKLEKATMIDNEIINEITCDKGLSLEALGLYSFLVWANKIHPHRISVNAVLDGIKKDLEQGQKILNELEERGYIKLVKSNNTMELIVYDSSTRQKRGLGD